MIAAACASSHEAKFIALLPAIRRQARLAFRGEPAERRGELVAEVIANCWVAFRRLVERGREHLAYPTPLAQFAIRQVRSGRRVGGRLNVRDVLSDYCQRHQGLRVERLDRCDARDSEWREIVVEDRRATPADTAAARIDIADWLATLPRRERRIAQTLALGESTSAAAAKFQITATRVSQLRGELRQAWERFSEANQPVALAAVA
jgi:hypothetical protein